ncbi:aldose epimerase family protein [Planctomyces sp. SH-PL62]|uniref:aldose epimerase family protein n=1 Tax=Planctomyces sp. SH-PL62 TaxID=1636152 RepID=UPI00078BDB58|nr:aldose epimerase family protein [Planctomyces sp. SH-PL62]AMV37073.1 Aldose 1-epimerase precursor [Planctomyces sp. SH-PL62]
MNALATGAGRFPAPLLGCLLSLAIVAPGVALGDVKGLSKMDFGKTKDGEAVELYTLKNGRIVVKVATYGATIVSIEAPDRDGKVDDVTLGFDTLEGYLGEHPYFGATVGRVANRIAKGKFTLDGEDYTLAVNNPPNALHGGLKGFNRVVWKARPFESPEGPAVEMTYTSPDGEEGYPGNLTVAVTFTVTADDELKIDYKATTDKATPLNLSNHTYFNLGGKTDASILDHELTLVASHYTPVDDTLIPTGEIVPVGGTPLDFTKPVAIGARIAKMTGDPGGYDHNFVLDGKPGALATVYDPRTGRVVEMKTTEPGVQFYSGNFLDGSNVGRGGVAYKKHHGMCLEAQHFPDSIHHPNFPNAVLRPGETYTQTTSYRFSTR